MRQESDSVVIRNLAPDELSAWLSFLRDEIFPEDPYEDVLSIWESDREKDTNGIFVATDPEGRIVSSVKAECGTLFFHDVPVFPGIISGVGTKKEYRNQGLGKRLFQSCHAYLKTRGAGIAYLYSEPDTVSFYRRLEYLDCSKRPEESFYRMFRVIQPFAPGKRRIACAKDFLDFLDGDK